MGYALMGLIGFGLGFISGAVYAYVFGEKSAEARPQGTNPEKENTDRASAKTEIKEANSWWNSQLHKENDERGFKIQFGTHSKEAYDKVARVCAQIMDEEYAAKRNNE